MVRQLFIGLVAEGVTDLRFLESIVKKTFEAVLLECTCDMDIILRNLCVPKSGFVEFVETASLKGVEELGIMTLCVHADADDWTSDTVYNDKIIPAQNHLNRLDSDKYCTLLTPIVPVRMTEAWMLADKELLKKEIGTVLSDSDLGINRPPEEIAEPKDVISNAIRIAQQNVSKRRRTLNISELYRPVGQKISIEKLRTLSSFRQFEEEVRSTYRELGYLH